MKKYFKKIIKNFNISLSFLLPIKFNVIDFDLNIFCQNSNYLIETNNNISEINYNYFLQAEENKIIEKYEVIYKQSANIINYPIKNLILCSGFVLWFFIIKFLQNMTFKIIL